MSKKLVLILKTINDDDEVILIKEISSKDIIPPIDTSNFGYNKNEQLQIIHDIQQEILDNQSVFLNQRPVDCPECFSPVWKSGKSRVSFNHIFTDHKVSMQQWCCSNDECRWTKTSNITEQLSGTIHEDLVKLQAESGANNSYRRAAKEMGRATGERKVNNHMRIRKNTNTVGNILAENQVTTEQASEAADELCAVADGGYVHDAHNVGHNFEVMTGKVFRPSNVLRIDKNHTSIIKKHCAGSAKADEQETMKKNLCRAAEIEGADKRKTEITALADGAKNCWNVLNSLESLCKVLVCILDWFHIGKYILRVGKSLPDIKKQLEEIKDLLWNGLAEEALIKINALSCVTNNKKGLKTIENFYEYISSNKEMIVDYQKRQDNGLPYTSHVAESTVEHIINERCKRKQKMQWSREGIHAVIQIRVSQASGNWDNDWEKIVKPILKKAA